VDRSGLASLIQADHLEEAAITSYRSAFQSSLARFVVFENFIVSRTAERLSEFLRREGEFHTEFGLYSSEEHKVDEADWLAASDDDRFFRYGRLVGTPPEFQFSVNSLEYLKFRTAFQNDDDLRSFFEACTGLQLARSDDFGSHSMGIGDFLKEHDDNNRNRRLALVLYLSPGWNADFGGRLHIRDREGGHYVVPCGYNSLVAFDTLADTVHYVEPITEVAGEARRVTIGGWYHNRP
jgi:2OG-Fe(II) oxygenase superfamily